MERLRVSRDTAYSPIEAAIHVGRYAPLLKHVKDRRVLDVACGEGYGSWLLKQFGAAHVTGVDVSREAIDVAQRLFASDDIRFQCGDWSEILAAIPDGQFDMIASIETIEHLSDPIAFLTELKRLASPDCIILITCPNDPWYYKDGEGNPHHLATYDFKSFQELTSGVLGSATSWSIGCPVQGFASLPVGAAPQSVSSVYVDVQTLPSAFVCPPDSNRPHGALNCSYFAGAWGGDRTIFGGAVFPMSMDDFAIKEGRATDLREREILTAAAEDWAARYKALESSHDALEKEACAAHAKVAVLMRETSILSANLAKAQASVAALSYEKAEIETSRRELLEAPAPNEPAPAPPQPVLDSRIKRKALIRFIRWEMRALRLKRLILSPSRRARRRYRARLRDWKALRKQLKVLAE